MNHLSEKEETDQEAILLQHLKHYLPSQLALKDFIHHNTLHAFQEIPFFEALQMAQETFGFRTTLSIAEYVALYHKGKISDKAIQYVLENDTDGVVPLKKRKQLLLETKDPGHRQTKHIGQLRKLWKEQLQFDLDTIVNHTLFKVIGSYLDQGISKIEFRTANNGLLHSIMLLEQETLFHLFHSDRVKDLLVREDKKLTELLAILVGDERYYEQYLFDQQFSHPGWSGFVAVAEEKPDMLYDPKKITLKEFIYFELLLEIDALDRKVGINKWKPLASYIQHPPVDMVRSVEFSVEWLVKKWWQQSFEMTYYDQVIKGISEQIKLTKEGQARPKFQAYFCIDDREESIRRNLETIEPDAQTFGTPAHFNLLIKYRPKGGRFNSHVCPAPAVARHIILDEADSVSVKRDLHFHQSSNGLFSGWIISQTLGFWSAIKLFVHLFKPSISPAHSSSFEHMSHRANPLYENKNGETLDGFQQGFSVNEMVEIVRSELTRTGLTQNFAPLVYLFGHGGSSTNNPYYAGYNCGACSGKPSSLNARVFARMANRKEVREALKTIAIFIPNDTQFIGGLHDTTRDKIVFYDEDTLSPANQQLHQSLQDSFTKALQVNAKERARQFISINTNRPAAKVHQDVEKRALSLFEPRPELNHSNNCLCIVGRRSLTKALFLDQRAFLNSYDYRLDADGKALMQILGATSPVCGGINLEYYFSRVDNEKLGSGSKLPHNVVGLFGVANGVEGDLRTGLPWQMVEVHDPLRLMMVVEQKPKIVLQVLHANPAIKEWYQNEWINLCVVDPDNGEVLLFKEGDLFTHHPFSENIKAINNLETIMEGSFENLPVYNISAHE
jgi:uncharacterized protein